MIQSVNSYLIPFAKNSEDIGRIEKILDAMRSVDRKFFVADKNKAYADAAMPAGEGQTISQPSTVGRELMLADIREGNDAMEVGTASGWNACLMGYLAYPGKVVSIEIFESLSKKAIRHCANLKASLGSKGKRLNNVIFKTANFFKMPVEKECDRIIITAGITSEQENLIEDAAKGMLKDNGILICPYTLGPMMILKKEDKELSKSFTLETYVFVPLVE